MGSPTYDKVRTLVDGTSVTATINLPSFPIGPDSNGFVSFAGAMGQVKIGGFDIAVASFTGLDSIDAKIQHSDDGSTWTDVDATNLAFTQATGNTTEQLDVPDDTFFKQYIRVAFTVVGSGSAAVTVRVFYAQCGLRDRLAPPGTRDKLNA